jgi:membrane associated rhomboid family serine protease
MFLIIPYHVDVPMQNRPWMNWVLIGVTILFYPLGESGFGESLVLGEGPLSWVGHVLVHGGILHLLGNMLFLWVFGNAVCAKVGNLAYLVIYFGLGFISGGIFYAIDPRPAVGASGAINGIVGIFVVWYLFNLISCWYVFWFFGLGRVGEFSVGSYWMVLMWMGFDILGAIWGGGNVGYIAHLAGLFAGVALGIVLLKTGLVEMERGERSLLDVFSGDDE